MSGEDQHRQAPSLRMERNVRKNCQTVNIVKDNENEDDWWSSDSASETGSYYSDSYSSTAEWESNVGPSGELLYVESLTDNISGKLTDNFQTDDNQGHEFKRRRSIRTGKFVDLIKRKESRRFSSRYNNKAISTTLKYRKEDYNKEECKNEVLYEDEASCIREISVQVDPEKRHKLGRRATLCEAYFGIIPGVSADNARVIVVGFIPDGPALKNKDIKIGDWIQRVNSQEVTPQTLEHTLSTEIVAPSNVKLILQSDTTSNAAEKDSSGTHSSKRSALVQSLFDRDACKVEELFSHPIGVIYMKTTVLLDASSESPSTFYTYPRFEKEHTQSMLCSARGAFVTLNHLLPGITGPQPVSTTMQVSGKEAHVVYTPRDEELLLIALPDEWCNLDEAVMLTTDIVNTLEFTYQSLSRCFTNLRHQMSLDNFFSLILQQLSRMTKDPSVYDTISVESYKLESSFTVGYYMDLPGEAQMQIDAALSEMEAMDYRDWNEEPMDCQRLYTILGSCIYHKSYLLGSHLAYEDFVEIQSLLRHNGILYLVEKEAVKCLVFWKRVYPSSWCEKRQSAAGVRKSSLMPNGKWFLLVVGYGHDLLAVLLESGGCTSRYDETSGPDVFYVEEAQETLKHIQKTGVTALAEKWITLRTNRYPQINNSTDSTMTKLSTSIAENLLGFMKSSEVPNMLSKIDADISPTVNSRKDHELTSVLKALNPQEVPVMSGSANSLQTSDDSLSQGTGAVSEMSDEALPILGRRATREKINNISRLKYSDDSVSDSDVYKIDRQAMSGEMLNIRGNLLHQAEYGLPKKLIAGRQNLFLGASFGKRRSISVTFSRLSGSISLPSKILRNFHRCVHVIHRLLHNAVRFKKMLNQDAHRNIINKSLIAIKEHGVLFQWENKTYWVVGRLFYTNPPREYYVCYEDSVPHNLIEIEFNLDS